MNIDTYKQQMAGLADCFDYEYLNEDLLDLMQTPQWKTLYGLLKQPERRTIQGYINYLNSRGLDGYLKAYIPELEAITRKLQQLLELELNARWVVCDRRLGLYWCSWFAPCWGKKRVAFLFISESEAQLWVKRFNKKFGSNLYLRFETQRIDATARLLRSPF